MNRRIAARFLIRASLAHRPKQPIPKVGVEPEIDVAISVMVCVEGAGADVSKDGPSGPGAGEWFDAEVAERPEEQVHGEVDDYPGPGRGVNAEKQEPERAKAEHLSGI
jgi:hypothetical protein